MIDLLEPEGLMLAELIVVIGSVLAFLAACSPAERRVIGRWVFSDIQRDKQALRRLTLRETVLKAVETILIWGLFFRLLCHTVAAASGAWKDLVNGDLTLRPRLLIAEPIQGSAPTRTRVRIVGRVLSGYVAFVMWGWVVHPDPANTSEVVMAYYLGAQWLILVFDAPEALLRWSIGQLSGSQMNVNTWQE